MAVRTGQGFTKAVSFLRDTAIHDQPGRAWRLARAST
jgi:hypothetical protein